MTAPALPTLLRGLLAEPGRPRLTWYGPDGERVELSGHVLDNWVSKTTNLLVEELDLGPGRTVLLDLPAHWRSVVWALAVWRAGACVVLDPAAPQVSAPGAATDVLVTSRPGAVGHLAAGAATEVVVVTLPALARSAGAALPPGAIDAASAVMTYGDALGAVPPLDPHAPALVLRGAAEGHDVVVRHADLLVWAVGAADGDPVTTEPPAAAPPRRLVELTRDEPVAALATALAAYRRDGSIVLCAPQVSAELAADPARRARLVASERVTA